MAAIATTAPIPSLRTPMVFSVLLHVLLFSSLIVSTIFSRRGEVWGGPTDGGVSQVKLVGSAPGINLPHPTVVTPNRNVDPTRGLYKEEPKPKSQPELDAKKLPTFTKEKPQKIYTRPSKVLENPVQPPPNAIDYGQGGTPDMPYSHFTMGAGTAGGVNVGNGPGAGGDFGSRYAWYVEAVRNRISSNWLISTVDPTVRMAPRAVLSFQILRNGTVANIQVTQSSGNRSVDDSGRRAILSSSPLPPLPNDYRGSNINVEFWFDFHR